MDAPVIFEINNHVGIIRLNSPKSLNCLKLEMIKSMSDTLKTWKNNDDVRAIILESTGDRAFCAGGDVVSIYKGMISGKKDVSDFFVYEYELDLLIHQYKKPILCLGDGIVMGGGIGIMNGCSHRVVTERSKMAMPEITIGLFPDVGGTYFLNKMPGKSGLFLGLTGARLNPSDTLYLSLTDYIIDSQDLNELKEEVLRVDWPSSNEENYNILTRILKAYSEKAQQELAASFVESNLEEINKISDFKDIKKLDEYWNSYKSKSEWISKSLENYLKGSPTSAAVIMEQIQMGKNLSLEEVFKKELVMAKQFTNLHDFQEGVRALLIDKDNSPKWNPSSLKEVTTEIINNHFTKSKKETL